MTSVISICNIALTNVGKPEINDLAEASAEARACNRFYEHTRDTLLQAYPWRFSGKTLSVAELTNDKPGAWRHAYKRPTDCLKVRWVRGEYRENPDDTCFRDADFHRDTLVEEIQNPYDIEGDTIYADLSPCLLRYTFRLTDPSRFSPLFTDALGWHLAVRLAMPLTRDPKMRADAYQLAQTSQAIAAMADANEVRENSDITSDTVGSRFHG